ncbi:MAG: hypothetical protein AB7S53_12170 [Thiomonas sp.]
MKADDLRLPVFANLYRLETPAHHQVEMFEGHAAVHQGFTPAQFQRRLGGFGHALPQDRIQVCRQIAVTGMRMMRAEVSWNGMPFHVRIQRIRAS